MKLSEDQYLKTLFKKIQPTNTVAVPPGDDCAALEFMDNQLLLLTVDQLSEGIHYNSQQMGNQPKPFLLGRKLLARNISDIAAMGGTPKYALVAHSIRSDCSASWLDNFTDGLLSLAQKYGITILGGDLARSLSNVSSLTLIGLISRHNLCLRSSASSGDTIMVTGEFGASLQNSKHLNFTPRLNEAKWLAENNFTRMIIDVSDGLLMDLYRVCEAAKLTATLFEERIPRAIIDNSPVSLSKAYLDGEDYELIFSVSQNKKKKLFEEWPFSTKIMDIGHFSPPQVTPIIRNLKGQNLLSKYKNTFDHFS